MRVGVWVNYRNFIGVLFNKIMGFKSLNKKKILKRITIYYYINVLDAKQAKHWRNVSFNDNDLIMRV